MSQDLNQLEQMSLNNTINLEALLEVLIARGVITEELFVKAKQGIEKRILDAARQSGGLESGA